MSGFCASEFALCHKTFRQAAELFKNGPHAAWILDCLHDVRLR
ncbi:hypothetical protein ENTCAN_08419 [Enterobacter cancerogenus ATCC 35316]|nr:hypothetical protein ENTCAN_08419 [Enterobacter cancerogenus ATCC 35316]